MSGGAERHGAKGAHVRCGGGWGGTLRGAQGNSGEEVWYRNHLKDFSLRIRVIRGIRVQKGFNKLLLCRAVEFGVVEGGGVVEGFEMGEDGDLGQGCAEVGFDLFEQLMPLEDGPGIWDEDVEGDEAARAGLPRAQGMVLDALLFVAVEDIENGGAF